MLRLDLAVLEDRISFSVLFVVRERIAQANADLAELAVEAVGERKILIRQVLLGDDLVGHLPSRRSGRLAVLVNILHVDRIAIFVNNRLGVFANLLHVNRIAVFVDFGLPSLSTSCLYRIGLRGFGIVGPLRP